MISPARRPVPPDMGARLAPTSRGRRSPALLVLPDEARTGGVHVQAGRGSGKSRLLGRVIAWQDFCHDFPVVILDPVGTTIDNFIDKMTRVPRKYQPPLWDRIIYVDMSGRGDRVVPWPLYYRLGDESLYEVAQRPLELFRSLDPFLQTASVLGWNALWTIGTYTGMALAAMSLQITEAPDLLANPEAWLPRLEVACRRQSDLVPVLAYFREYAGLSFSDRQRQNGSFLTKVAPFTLDAASRAMFGASAGRINWADVVARRQAVLLDFRHELGIEQRRAKMLLVFSTFLDFVRWRGAGRHQRVSLIIDELAAILGPQPLSTSPFAKQLDEFVNTWMRAGRVMAVICHQEAFQVDEGTLKPLMSLATQIVGVTTDQDTALSLAKLFFPASGLRAKRFENVWGSDALGHFVLEQRPVEYTIEEEHYRASEYFKGLGLFEFVVRLATREGEIGTRVYQMNIKRFDQGQWIDEPLVTRVRETLSARSGVPVGSQRLLEKQASQSVTLETNGTNDLYRDFAEVLRDDA